MTSESTEAEVVEDAPQGKARSLPMIVGAALLVTVLIVAVAGGLAGYLSARALRAELAAVKKEIKELKDLGQKDVPEDNTVVLEAALKDMKLQVEALTKQIGTLMASVAAHAEPDEPPTAQGAGAQGKLPVPAVGEGGKPREGKTPEAKDSAKSSGAVVKKYDVRNCDLIGKSPEEQAAIMKRCVSLIDPPNEKGAPSK